MNKVRTIEKVHTANSIKGLVKKLKHVKKQLKKQHKVFCRLRREQEGEMKEAIKEDCSKTMKKVKVEMKQTKKEYKNRMNKLKKKRDNIRRKIREIKRKRFEKERKLIAEKLKIAEELNRQKIKNLDNRLVSETRELSLRINKQTNTLG
jgi:hypothetical protein